MFGLGGLIIVFYWLLEYVAQWLSKYTSHGTYKLLEWTANDTLQLQRLAHEELGLGTWSSTATCYPITMPGEHLATIDISDPKHPKLKTSITKSETSSDELLSKNDTATIAQHDPPVADLYHTNSVSDSALTLLDSSSPVGDGQARSDMTTGQRKASGETGTIQTIPVIRTNDTDHLTVATIQDHVVDKVPTVPMVPK